MEPILKEKTAQAVQKLYNQDISPQEVLVNLPPKDFPYDFTVVVFPFSKISKKSPDQTAKEIGEELKSSMNQLASYEAIKGFLNLRLKDEYWIEFLVNNSRNNSFGSSPLNGEKIMIEYCGPNTNKPLHFGHLRNIFLGYSMSRILKAAGYEVVKVNIYNDRGVHICKSMLAYQKYGNHETPESSGEKGDHLVGEYYVRFEKELKEQVASLIKEDFSQDGAKKMAPLNIEIREMLLKWENGDAEVRTLWQTMNQWVYQGFEQTYKALGVDFDDYYYESETYLAGKEVVEEGLMKELFFKKPDGSVWVDLTADGLDEKLLLRADGTSVYITQDLGTADMRYSKYKIGNMIYTVANEQDYHFKVLKLVCKKLRRPYADSIYHLSYGLVDLPTGRMKTREGTVVDADDTVEEMITTAEEKTKEVGKIENFSEEELKQLYRILGLGALKFFLLKVDPKKKMIFSPEESIDFHGFTGPFIQYTYARIKSVLRKAASMSLSPESFSDLKTLQPQERQLILQLQQYPSVVKEAANKYEPSIIANYLYHLAKSYNGFYAELPILNAEDDTARAFRLNLSSFIASVISKGMFLLGIDVPERM
ncbi:MAG: arginine--tRNA ligase [Chitinophagales bacterium]|nr:arginine--tRNA ligase [Chitinophagales bacterium]